MSGWGEEYDVRIPRTPRARRRISKPVYQTAMGAMYCGDAERVLRTKLLQGNLGKAQLIFTSPPFPLKTKKRYGNLEGEAYVRWFASFAPLFRDHLTPDGSIVIEIGNAWEAGRPVMSTVVLRALLQSSSRAVSTCARNLSGTTTPVYQRPRSGLMSSASV